MKQDAINPPHYKAGKVECIDALESATIYKQGIEAVCVANVIKYLWRYEANGGVQDCKKAKWYLERLIYHLETKENSKDCVDCHADKSARNDRKTNAQAPKVDSSKNEQSNNSNPATRRQDFGDKNGAFANAHKGVTLAVMTAGRVKQSPFLAQKPTPKTRKEV